MSAALIFSGGSLLVAVIALTLSRVVTRRVRVTVHRAAFADDSPYAMTRSVLQATAGPECYFVNVTNVSLNREVEVTHIWFESLPTVNVVRTERPLPRRLKVDETWETWVGVNEFPAGLKDADIYKLARVRLSNGKTFRSQKNERVPHFGHVPGGDTPPAPGGTFVPTKAPEESPRPHFEFTGLRYRALFISPYHKDGVVEPTTDEQESQAIMGVTLSFTNVAAGPNSKRAINVVARIRFYSAEWTKSRDIPYGLWLNSPCNCTEMEIGAVEELVVILVNGTDYRALRDLRTGRNRQYQEYFKVEGVSWMYYVRVKLTDQISGTSTTFALRIWHDGQGWCHHSVSPPASIENVPW